MTKTMKIAAYDGDGIWGVGDTAEQALAEAEGYRRDSFASQSDPALLRTLAGHRTAPIDAELLAEVHDAGAVGYEFFAIVDGVLVCADEMFNTTQEAEELVDA